MAAQLGGSGPGRVAVSRPLGQAAAPVAVRPPSAEAVAAVKQSFRAVADRPARLAEEFYAHLFEMAPQLRSMFPADMTTQMQKMADTLIAAVAHLDTRDTTRLETALHRLGADHHARYRVQAEHYMYIGHALTRAVRDLAGPGYSGALSSAWIAVYQWVAAHMIAGAEAPADVDDAGVEVPRQRGRDADVAGPRQAEERHAGGGSVQPSRT